MGKKKVFWISLFIPYDKVSHAGGKIHNYYLKTLHKTEQFDVRLLTFATKSDMEKQDLDDYGIQYEAICYGAGILNKLGRGLINVESMFNPFNRYGRALQNYHILKIRRHLKRYSVENYEPDIVILQWTQMVFFLPLIRQYFPKARIISIEEDVSYLSYKRKKDYYKNPFSQFACKISYRKVKKLELERLRQSDLIILNNHKDEKLLKQDGLDEKHLSVWIPFFQNYLEKPYYGITKNIIFYGGMARPENYLSAIWFIENVMPLLADTDIVFQVIGANPDKSLFKYKSNRVHIIGFVDHVENYFSGALCLVAPLVLGAGVKIKILEAMSAGVPVLTNDIGIEGIPAIDRKDYFYCSEPEEYANIIRILLNNKQIGSNMSRNEITFIRDNYDIKKSANQFINWINKM